MKTSQAKMWLPRIRASMNHDGGSEDSFGIDENGVLLKSSLNIYGLCRHSASGLLATRDHYCGKALRVFVLVMCQGETSIEFGAYSKRTLIIGQATLHMPKAFTVWHQGVAGTANPCS